MDLNSITPELREKAKACKTSEEVVQLAKDNGVELTDEQLQAVSGGEDWFDCGEVGCPVDEPGLR